MKTKQFFPIILLVCFIFCLSVADVFAAAPSFNLSATAVSSSQINLSWGDTNETSYLIERSLTSNFQSVTTFPVNKNTITYSNVGLSSGTLYYYRVKALDRKGTTIKTTNTASATTQSSVTTPNAPSSLSATAASSSQINLSWADNSSNETGFKIERATSSTGPWSQIATVGANVNSYQNTGLSASTTYYYHVHAYNTAGDSAVL